MPEMNSQTDQEDDLRIIFGLMEDEEVLKDEALRELLRKYGGIIRGMVRKKYGDDLQEDEVQDVLIRTATKAWRYADSFDDRKASLGTWLVSIALREATDVLKENISEFDWIEDEGSIPDGFSDEEAIEDGEVDSKEEKKLFRDLDAVIDALPSLQRAIIRADLKCGGTADAERLAELHGSTKNSIYVSRKKAKKKIELELNKLGHFKPV